MEIIAQVEFLKGEKYTCLVRSSQPNQPPYRVEIDGYNFNGDCACLNFRCNHGPELSRKRNPIGTDETRCRHIKLARRKFCTLKSDAAWIEARTNGKSQLEADAAAFDAYTAAWKEIESK